MVESIGAILKRMAREAGFSEVNDYLSNQVVDSVCDGYCRACEETFQEFCEPDATENYCELCGENRVISSVELMMEGM